MNCDWIAPFYQFFERAAFGGKLQRHRLAFLGDAANCQHALVLGDGDGRFTKALITAYPALEVDSVELSAGMVAQATRRKVPMIHADAFQYPFAKASYDIVFTHFFLDCFETARLTMLISHVSETLIHDGIWILSDFRQSPTGWRKLYTRAWLATMYFFFKLATGLTTRTLPDYEAALKLAGFRKRQEQVSGSGLIVSQKWQR